MAGYQVSPVNNTLTKKMDIFRKEICSFEEFFTVFKGPCQKFQILTSGFLNHYYYISYIVFSAARVVEEPEGVISLLLCSVYCLLLLSYNNRLWISSCS